MKKKIKKSIEGLTLVLQAIQCTSHNGRSATVAMKNKKTKNINFLLK